MRNTFTQHLELPETELEKLLSLSVHDFINSPQVANLLNTVDIKLLQENFAAANLAMGDMLPCFYRWLVDELKKINLVEYSRDYTTNWGNFFLKNRESLNRLFQLHDSVPRPALENSIPLVVGLFDEVEDGRVRQEWQKAVAAFCLAVVVDARDRERMAIA